MPIPIKYTTTNVSSSIRKGNIALGVNAVDYGPSSTTGWTNAVPAPNSGYAIYYLSGTDLRMRTAADDTTLITVAGQIMGTTYTSVSGSLAGLAAGGYTVVNTNPPNIVTSGSAVSLNSALIMSYPQAGTAWYDLSGNTNNGTVNNGPTFDLTTGALTFDGTNDFVGFSNQTQFQTPTFTVDGVISPTAGNDGTIVLFTRESARLNLGIAYGGSTGAYFFIRGSNYPTAELNGVQQAYTFTNGLFYYVTFIVDIPGNNYKFYVNGNQVWSSNIALGTNFQSPTNTQGVIASRYGGSSNYSKCRISSFNFYNRVLNASEVIQNYYKGNIVTDGLVLALDAGNLVSYPGSGTTWISLTGSNNGTLTNGPTFSSANGGSIVFDGTNDYVLVNSNASIPYSSSARTISIWFYTNSSTWVDNVNNLFFYGAGSTGNAFGIDFSTYPFMEIYTWGGAGRDLTFSTTYSQVGWKNISITYNGSTTILIYENGTFTQTLNLSSACNTTLSSVYIGAINPSIQSWYYDGNIAHVSIYNRSLSASEIQQNYNAQKSRFNL